MSATEERTLEVGDLVVDLFARYVTREGQSVGELTGKEWDLLVTLAAEPTRVFTRQELGRRVWRWDFVGDSRTIDTHACRLRSKLGRPYVQNVWGVGYRLLHPEAI